MKLAATVIALALAVTGCDELDKVMGRTPGTPIPAPTTERPIDCNLIFPGGGADRR